MTDLTGNSAHPAGWYADPAGTPRQRWWDGAQWTGHLHDPALEVYGVVAPSILGPGTPVYNVFIWALTLSPILSILRLLTTDLASSAVPFRSGAPALPDPGYLLSQVLGLAVYGGTVLLAYVDRRRLGRDGFPGPFHWAWAFLATGVYVIGRSVIVRRRAGRGLAPIWVWAGLALVSFVVTAIKLAELMAVLLPTLGPAIPS